VVYVAEQTEPVRRRVAFKVIKLGMDTNAVVARFEAERQARALDHDLRAAIKESAGPFAARAPAWSSSFCWARTSSRWPSRSAGLR
jgi:hypothetical protein